MSTVELVPNKHVGLFVKTRQLSNTILEEGSGQTQLSPVLYSRDLGDGVGDDEQLESLSLLHPLEGTARQHAVGYYP